MSSLTSRSALKTDMEKNASLVAARPADYSGRAAALAPENRLASSRRKIRSPFQLDPTMCFYSPQSNLEALHHPRVNEWLSFVENEWLPLSIDDASGRIALLMPCTKFKPYPTSREHRSINSALHSAGWRPIEPFDGPEELKKVLRPGENADLLAVSPLWRDGIVLDRFVISEPLAVVPYELTMSFRGAQSPATSYDDPGLFENRGTSVSPERADCTATLRSDGSWAWGPVERESYAQMHNAMASSIAATFRRIGPHYEGILAWMSPGLTHRSFLADAEFRLSDGLPLARRGTKGEVALNGALNELPGLIRILPSRAQTERAKDELAERLRREDRSTTASSVAGTYARGDGNDTPLGLAELTAMLVAEIDQEVAGK